MSREQSDNEASFFNGYDLEFFEVSQNKPKSKHLLKSTQLKYPPELRIPPYNNNNTEQPSRQDSYQSKETIIINTKKMAFQAKNSNELKDFVQKTGRTPCVLYQGAIGKAKLPDDKAQIKIAWDAIIENKRK